MARGDGTKDLLPEIIALEALAHAAEEAARSLDLPRPGTPDERLASGRLSRLVAGLPGGA